MGDDDDDEDMDDVEDVEDIEDNDDAEEVAEGKKNGDIEMIDKKEVADKNKDYKNGIDSKINGKELEESKMEEVAE